MSSNVELSDYLILLESLRDDLAANLRKRGVQAENAETLQSLVPKVLYIPQGNPYLGYFEGTLAKTHINNGEYGVFLYGETVPMSGVFNITGYYKMASAVLTLTGSGLSLVTINAPGWLVSVTDDTRATLTLDTAEIQASGLMQSYLDAITFSYTNSEPAPDNEGVADKAVHVSISFKAIEQDTGTEYPIEGSCTFDIQRNSWDHVEDTYPLMSNLDTHTWSQVEDLVV